MRVGKRHYSERLKPDYSLKPLSFCRVLWSWGLYLNHILRFLAENRIWPRKRNLSRKMSLSIDTWHRVCTYVASHVYNCNIYILYLHICIRMHIHTYMHDAPEQKLNFKLEKNSKIETRFLEFSQLRTYKYRQFSQIPKGGDLIGNLIRIWLHESCRAFALKRSRMLQITTFQIPLRANKHHPCERWKGGAAAACMKK